MQRTVRAPVHVISIIVLDTVVAGACSKSIKGAEGSVEERCREFLLQASRQLVVVSLCLFSYPECRFLVLPENE